MTIHNGPFHWRSPDGSHSCRMTEPGANRRVGHVFIGRGSGRTMTRGDGIWPKTSNEFECSVQGSRSSRLLFRRLSGLCHSRWRSSTQTVSNSRKARSRLFSKSSTRPPGRELIVTGKSFRSSLFPSCFPATEKVDTAVPRNYVHACEAGGIKVVQIGIDHVPVRPIEAEGFAGGSVNLHQPCMIDPCGFQAESLTASAGAERQSREPALPLPLREALRSRSTGSRST